MLIDSHCHLDFPDFSADLPGRDRPGEGRRRHRDAHDLHPGRQGRHLPGDRRGPSRGLVHDRHPSARGRRGAGRRRRDDRRARPASPRCVGIGEAGLDYHYADAAPESVQERVLRAHIEAARLSGLPLVIHARDADDHMERVLADEMGRRPFRAVLHCFSSGAAAGRGRAWSWGCSCRSPASSPSAARTPCATSPGAVPLDRILVETDAPFLAPEPHRGRTNEPAYTADTARSLAETLGLAAEDFARLTTANFFAPVRQGGRRTPAGRRGGCGQRSGRSGWRA